MKILHLSDLHFCTSFKRENIAKTKKILRRAIQESFDHLVITGDISDNSNADDYEILKAMLKNFGLYSSEKTSIVIPPDSNDLKQVENVQLFQEFAK